MVHGLELVETEQSASSIARAVDGASLPDRILSAVNYAVVLLSSVALVTASLVLTYSVVTRYFLRYSTDWQDETAVFLIVGAVFMSAAAIQANRGHVAIEVIAELMSPQANAIRVLIVDLACAAFCGYFAWKSWALLNEAVEENYHSGSTWGPPLWIPYSLMSVGMSLLTMQLLLQIARELRRPKSRQ